MKKPTRPRTREEPLDREQLRRCRLEELVADPEQRGVLLEDVSFTEGAPAPDSWDLDESVLVRLTLGPGAVRARLDQVDLVECDLANAELRGSWWHDVLALDCRLTGVDLSETRLTRVTFDHGTMSLASLRDATLEHVSFIACDLRGVDLSEATLTDVRFDGCELDGFTTLATTFDEVDLSGSELGGDIDVAGLRGATIDVDQALLVALQLTRRHGIHLAVDPSDDDV